MILPGFHTVTKLIIQREHLRLWHMGPTNVTFMLSHRFHIVRAQKIIRSIICACVTCTCHHIPAKPKSQMLGQIPTNQLEPGSKFDRVGVDYARPVLLKRSSIYKRLLTKGYICVFVCLVVKAVHL